MGLEPSVYQEHNDAFHFFEAIQGLIITGLTGTNVMDVYVAACEK